MTIEEYFGKWLKFIGREEALKIMDWLKTVNPNLLCPSLSNVFKAFRLCPYDKLKVVIIGQEPYSDKYLVKPRATGILFGNSKEIPEDKLSPSLQVLKESVINFEVPHNLINFDNSLESWAEQGVLMINSSLTCEVNKVGSHILKWQPFMAKFLMNLSNRDYGLVYLLLGRQAQSLKQFINTDLNTVFELEHPAYFARTSSKMPSKVFININRVLRDKYNTEIKWFEEI